MSAADPIQPNVEATFSPLDSGAGGAVGGAVAQLGDAAGNFAVQLGKAQQEKDLVAARLEGAKQIGALDDTFRTDTDPDTMAKRYSDAAAKIGQNLGGALQGSAATAFSEDYGTMAEAHLRNIKDIAFNRTRQQSTALVDETVDTESKAAAYAANPAEYASHVENARKAISGLVDTGMMSAVEGRAKQQTFDDRLALYQGKSAVFLNPSQAMKNLADPNYLPQLDPLARVELQHSAEAEVHVRAREARQDLAMTRMQASQDAGQLHDVIASGLPVAQSLIDQAKASTIASGDPRATARLVGLLKAQGFADSLRGAAPREVDAGIEALTAQANKAGADDALATALTAARAFKQKMNEGLAHDPLLWAQSQGVANITPLNLNGSDAPQAFAQRLQQAQQVSQRYGVPVTPLTQAESETLKTRLDKDQNPDVRLHALQTVVNGFGAAAQPVLGKIGGGDPALANAGTLVASGPAYLGTARDVLTGTSLLSSKANENLRPSPGGLAGAGINTSLSAFALMPNSLTAVKAGSEALYAAQAARQGLAGGDAVNSSAGRALLQKSVQQAAGARFDPDGTQWGGIGQYRGAAALVPGNIKSDDFEDLVHHLRPADLAAASVSGKPPSWEGGGAPDNLMHRTWLVSMGNGNYALSVTDPAKGAITPVQDSGHAPFRFRFNTALVAMQARTKAGQ